MRVEVHRNGGALSNVSAGKSQALGEVYERMRWFAQTGVRERGYPLRPFALVPLLESLPDSAIKGSFFSSLGRLAQGPASSCKPALHVRTVRIKVRQLERLGLVAPYAHYRVNGRTMVRYLVFSAPAPADLVQALAEHWRVARHQPPEVQLAMVGSDAGTPDQRSGDPGSEIRQLDLKLDLDHAERSTATFTACSADPHPPAPTQAAVQVEVEAPVPVETEDLQLRSAPPECILCKINIPATDDAGLLFADDARDARDAGRLGGERDADALTVEQPSSKAAWAKALPRSVRRAALAHPSGAGNRFPPREMVPPGWVQSSHG